MVSKPQYRDTGKYEARIRIDGVLKHLGLFVVERDGALAYDAAAREHFGEFARLNFSELV